jgi:hypothetical protein
MRLRLGWGILSVLLAAGPAFGQFQPVSPFASAQLPAHHQAEEQPATAYPKAEPFTPSPKVPAQADEETHEEAELLPFHRVWVTGEYLLWRIRASKPPLLVSSGQGIDPVPGALGNPGTDPLYGGANANNGWRSGGRFFLGGWFDCEEQYGAEAGYLFLASRDTGFFQAGDGSPTSPIIARPFLNALTQSNDASLVSFPGLIAGAIAVSNTSSLQGAEVNGLVNLYMTRGFRLDALAGMRFLYLTEALQVRESDLVQDGSPVLANTSITVLDRFKTTNNFYAGQVGFKAALRRDHWDFEVVGKLAAGSMNQQVGIHGATALVPLSGPAALFPAGFLALPSNSGDFHRDVFTFAPEVTLRFGYKCTEWLHLTAGYSFLYVDSVLRPGEQVDTTINPNQVPTSLTSGPAGPARPAFAFHGTGFFAHGAAFGLLFQY